MYMTWADLAPCTIVHMHPSAMAAMDDDLLEPVIILAKRRLWSQARLELPYEPRRTTHLDNNLLISEDTTMYLKRVACVMITWPQRCGSRDKNAPRHISRITERKLLMLDCIQVDRYLFDLWREHYHIFWSRYHISDFTQNFQSTFVPNFSHDVPTWGVVSILPRGPLFRNSIVE